MRKPKPNPSLAVAYLRVSTDEQKLGMDAQRSAITAWADRHGITIAAWCEDLGVSGGAELADRPGLLEALEMVRAGKVGRFIAHKADRLGRDAYLTAGIRRDIRKMGAELSLAEGTNGDSPEALLMATIEDGFAEFERAKIRARTKAALGVKKTRGERISGRLPYGFQLAADGIQLEPCQREQEALERMRELRKDGLGGVKIARTLAAEGFLPRGKAWDAGNVQRIADAALALVS